MTNRQARHPLADGDHRDDIQKNAFAWNGTVET